MSPHVRMLPIADAMDLVIGAWYEMRGDMVCSEGASVFVRGVGW